VTAAADATACTSNGNQLIGGGRSQVTQFVGRAVEKAPLRACLRRGLGDARKKTGSRPLDSRRCRAMVIDQRGAPYQRSAVKMVKARLDSFAAGAERVASMPNTLPVAARRRRDRGNSSRRPETGFSHHGGASTFSISQF